MSNYIPRLKKVYKDKIAPELFKELGYTSVMQIPSIKKIVVSMGVGEALTNKKLLDAAVTDITLITGQQAVKTKAKKSIANFKLREGNEVGVMVTLRGAHMYELRTSAASIRTDSTVTEIILSVLRNKSFSPKLTSIKSNAFPV